MKTLFQYEFDDESPDARITMEYGPNDDEELEFGFEGHELFLTANRAGFLCLAKLFVKLALGDYKEGFHLHIGEDFSSAAVAVGQSLCIAIADRVGTDESVSDFTKTS